MNVFVGMAAVFAVTGCLGLMLCIMADTPYSRKARREAYLDWQQRRFERWEDYVMASLDGFFSFDAWVSPQERWWVRAWWYAKFLHFRFGAWRFKTAQKVIDRFERAVANTK